MSWKGFSKSNSGWAYGNTSASSRLMRRARRTRAVRDSFRGDFVATVFVAEAFLTGAAAFLGATVAFFTAAAFLTGAAFFAEALFSTGAFPAAFAVFFPPPTPCSPTAESRRTTTRPAPLACALTGVLDTRPA